MGRQWNTIIESLGPLSGGTMSINANLTEIEALLTTLQADVADGITVSSGTVTASSQSILDGLNAYAAGYNDKIPVVAEVDSLPAISGTVTANGGDFTGTQSATEAPNKIVQLGYYDEDNTEFLRVTPNSRFPVGNGPLEGIIATKDANTPTSAVTIGHDDGGTFRLTSSTKPLPVYSPTSTSGGTGATTATSTTFATALASNTSRKGATIFNEGPGIMYLTIGTATTSTSQYATRLSGGDYYELPYNYTGQIGYIFGSAGTARVTEIV